jgi:APA family basic amino acid/polyamine antiporter
VYISASRWSSGGSVSRIADDGPGFPGWSLFGAMVLSALWAYDGWNNLPMAAGEVREPQKNLPRAIVWGTLGVFAIYALVNVGYFYAQPYADIVAPGSDSVAQRAAGTFLGGTAQTLLATAMVISALSAMNGSILTGARVPYAVARDGLAPRQLGRVSAKSHVPVTAVLAQGALSCVYALSSSFDQLTDAVVFASWLFYALKAGTVLLLRIREPERARSYRVPGFPVIPVLVMALALLLLINTLWTAPRASALGLSATALGAIVYFAIARRRARIQ